MRTEIVVLLDRSGSMSAIRGDIIGGFNAFLDDQRKDPNEAYLTLAQFDSVAYDVVFERKGLSEAPYLTTTTFVPRGCTPLLDAIGRTIVEQGERFAKASEARKPEKVVFVIMTDGLENASHEYTKARVVEMLKRQQDEWRWAVTYIGANQDAILEAGSYGIQAAAAVTYTPSSAGVKGVVAAMSSQVRSIRGTGGSFCYSPADRKNSTDGGL